jgi:hypothetical protein
MTESAAFRELQAFLKSRMRMSHIYQPLMLRVLIEGDGRANGMVRPVSGRVGCCGGKTIREPGRRP